jgi:hypothetical protein
MNKWLTASILTLGLSISVSAADLVPVNTKGEQTHPQYAASSTCMLTASSTTLPVLCATGSGIVLQVIASSVTTTDYIVMRDTATQNVTSTELLRLSASGIAGTYVYPRFKNGLSVNASATPGPGATGAWTVIYTKDLR